MELTAAAELRAVLNSRDVLAVASRARVVLCRAEARPTKQVAALAGVYGTTNLFAALEVATGQVTADCYPRHRRGVPGLPEQGIKPHAGRENRVVLDNLPTHTTLEVEAWLARHRSVTFHVTPVGQRPDRAHPRLCGAPDQRGTVRVDRHHREMLANIRWSRPTSRS